MKKFITLLIILLILAFGITFALKNPQSVEISYYAGLYWQGPLTVLLLITWVVGICVGVLMTFLKTFRLSRQVKKSQRDLAKTQSKIEQQTNLAQTTRQTSGD